MVRCSEKARVLGYTWFAPGCEGTHNTQESVWEGTSFSGLRCFCCRYFACPWENRSSCCSLRINGTMKEEYEDGEVSKGAAKRSRKPFHTAPIIVASLIRRRSSTDVKRVPKLQEKSRPLPPCLALHKENSIPCVCISFSVNVNQGFQDSLGNQLIMNFSHLGSQGGKLIICLWLFCCSQETVKNFWCF